MELVIMKFNTLLTTSLLISKGMKIEHRAVLQLIKKYKQRKIFQTSTFQLQIFTTKGRSGEFYYLNENQTLFIITLMKNSELVLDFKESLFNAFVSYREIAHQKYIRNQDLEYQVKRLESKLIRKECTDTIKEFIEYAIQQGSKSASTYYVNLSKMELKGLFLIEQCYPNMRDVMTVKQLNLIEMADEAVRLALEEGMMNQLHYKEIYKLAKSKIETIASVFPKYPLPALLGYDSNHIKISN